MIFVKEADFKNRAPLYHDLFMKKYFNTTLGFYESPFFRLKVNTTPTSLDMSQMKESDAAVFIHEYIHFLQAITTIYGLNQLHITVEYFRDANNVIYSCPKPGPFQVPINPEITRGKNVYFNFAIFSRTKGDTQDFDNVTLTKEPEIFKEEIDPTCAVPFIHSIVLSFRNAATGEGLYSFGAACIMESMAYMLEQYISPNGYEKSPDLPYNSAMLVAKKIYPAFARDPLNVLALCDLSLLTTNPGLFFVCILNEWKKSGQIPVNPEFLYHYFYQLEWQPMCSRAGTIDLLLQDMLKLVKVQLFEYLKPDDDPNSIWSIRVNKIRTWITEILNSASMWRTKHKTFILDLARGGTRLNNETFKDIYNDFGIPFCMNKAGAAFIYHKSFGTEKPNLDYLVAIGQIFRTFNGNKDRCELFPLCKMSGKKTPDKLCETPWLMHLSEKNLCPYALVWHHWNLDGYTPDFQ